MRFEIGDEVVIRKPENVTPSTLVYSEIEEGMCNSWEPEMDIYDGEINIIIGVSWSVGYLVDGNQYYYLTEWLKPVV